MSIDRVEGQDLGELLRGCYTDILNSDKDLKVLKAANTKANLIPLRFSQHARTLIGMTGQAPVWKTVKEQEAAKHPNTRKRSAERTRGNNHASRGAGRGGG